MRMPTAAKRPRIAKVKAFPAPTRGWIANENLAVATAQGAAVLDNWFPTATSVRMRRGREQWTAGDGEPITSIFTYNSGSLRKAFGATATDIYDVSSSWDTAPTPEVTSLTGGDWIGAQFSNSGGEWLRLVNGTDDPLTFDGTTFSTSPAITGIADPADLNYVWSFKNRLFFIEAESLSAWYLPIDAIGGVAVEFPMQGVFPRGGALLFGASWSLNENGGLSDSCVFVTTEGEVAVYQGFDPNTAADWTLAGVYRIGKPLGKKAHMRAGGDLLVATDIGLVPLSQAVNKDFAALAPNSVSFPIETAWNQAVADRTGLIWHCELWPTQQMVVVSVPEAAGEDDEMFVANARTGAWSRFTGISGTCLALFGDRLLVGMSDGQIVQMETTGSDLGSAYTATLVPLFDDLKTPSALKVAALARAVLLSTSVPNERITVQVDYNLDLPPAPDAPASTSTDAWGTATWGGSTWGATSPKETYMVWRSIYGAGYALAPCVQITSGSTTPIETELVRIEMTFDTGDVLS